MSVFDLDTVFSFKSHPDFFWKERDGVKNNTVRKVELDDERFRMLIAWSEIGFNDRDIWIEIVNCVTHESFKRTIRDISVYEKLMIITWNFDLKKE